MDRKANIKVCSEIDGQKSKYKGGQLDKRNRRLDMVNGKKEMTYQINI